MAAGRKKLIICAGVWPESGLYILTSHGGQGIRAEYWSTGQALGHGVAPGSAPLAFGIEARPCGGASLQTGSLSPHLLGNVSVDSRASYYFT